MSEDKPLTQEEFDEWAATKSEAYMKKLYEWATKRKEEQGNSV